MTTLITGGGGYIGIVLAEALLAAGERVAIFDRFYFGKNLLGQLVGHPHLRTVRGDVRWMEAEVLSGVDTVLELAGLSNDPSADLDPALTEDINKKGAVHVAQMARQAGVKRFIYSSSCSVYGSGDGSLGERSPRRPVSLYAETKAAAEDELLSLASSDFSVTVLRNGTLYGLAPRMRFDLVVNLMTLYAFAHSKIYVMGDGNQWRPLIHVRDVARAFMDVMRAPVEKVNGETFNVGSNEQNYQVKSIARMVVRMIPSTQVEKVPDDPDKRSYRVDFSKIRDVLGFQAKYGVEDGVREVYEALDSGLVEDSIRTKTVAFYRHLLEAERLVRELSLNGQILHRMREGLKAGMRVEFYRHGLGDEELESVRSVLDSLFLTTGPRTGAFERELAAFLEVPATVGVSSCTAALFLSLKALGISPGDEVITTPMTFVATSNAILHAGAVPVFVDVEADTGNLDAERLEDALTERTAAVLPVHLYGHMVDMRRMRAFADRHGLALVEDAAHALEATRDGERPGQLGDVACFSFYATKNLSCGEGGAVTVGTEELEERMRALRLHGMTRGAYQRYEGGYGHWDMTMLGYKANMSDLQAALLLPQMRHVEERLRRREAIGRIYAEGLADVPGVALPAVRPSARSARHLQTVWVDAERRDGILKRLQEVGVGVAVNYRSVHLLTYYSENFGFRRGQFPNAERIGDRTISLPLYPSMSDAQAEHVVETLSRILAA